MILVNYMLGVVLSPDGSINLSRLSNPKEHYANVKLLVRSQLLQAARSRGD